MTESQGEQGKDAQSQRQSQSCRGITAVKAENIFGAERAAVSYVSQGSYEKKILEHFYILARYD